MAKLIPFLAQFGLFAQKPEGADLFDLRLTRIGTREARASEAEMRQVTASLAVPQIANLVVGGRTPLLPQQALADIGFSIVLYANTPLQAAMRAMGEVLGALKRDGGLDAVKDRLAGFDERQRLVDKASYDALEKLYAVE